ncbi:hypothetical protein M145_1112 [Bacteroides fragilis str. 34-F-2 |nr:hypothetical protein M145_1112 [Bacteroides fragilis str. 34-F-2 \
MTLEALLCNIFKIKVRDENRRRLPFKPKARWFKTKEGLV